MRIVGVADDTSADTIVDPAPANAATAERRRGLIGTLIGRYEIQWHLLMAASLFAVLPVLLLFIAIERHLVGGLTAGGIRLRRFQRQGGWGGWLGIGR